MLSWSQRGRDREVNENLMGRVWLIPELMVLNSERKGEFGLRVGGWGAFNRAHRPVATCQQPLIEP